MSEPTEREFLEGLREEDKFPPCPMHGEGFICDHDPDEDYADEWR